MRLILLLLLPGLLSASMIYAQPCQLKAAGVLDEALGFMKKNYYRRDEVRWDEIANEARTRLKGSNNCDDVYDIISWCFKQLNEQHSFIMPPIKAGQYNYDPSLAPSHPFPNW
jgi:hypothetical protein